MALDLAFLFRLLHTRSKVFTISWKEWEFGAAGEKGEHKWNDRGANHKNGMWRSCILHRRLDQFYKIRWLSSICSFVHSRARSRSSKEFVVGFCHCFVCSLVSLFIAWPFNLVTLAASLRSCACSSQFIYLSISRILCVFEMKSQTTIKHWKRKQNTTSKQRQPEQPKIWHIPNGWDGWTYVYVL